ncbi:aldo/keto reductase [Chishuiella sp.]|uniref:aldo/keto reductase n=1 Tax=Chishuiella sp. TaxID=1969467 RepID=UPI0028B17A50|nr:aldo/keto reductase [Chishuiella sp.]
MLDITSKIKLYNEVELPILGLGVYKTNEGDEVINAIHSAIDEGCRLIDTASYYDNEIGVGKAINSYEINRSELFVTTKVWIDDMGYDKTIHAFYQSLKNLNLDYIDLYLIHWPVADQFIESWKALEFLYEAGLVKSIGVSNCLQHHLETIQNNCVYKPMVVQNEFHPRLIQQELVNYCKDHEIAYQAWAPLMRGRLLENEILKSLAKKYNKSVAQIILRWDLQKGIATIPKSVNPERIKENCLIFDFELSLDDIDKIDSLNTNERTGADPDNFLDYFANKK